MSAVLAAADFDFDFGRELLARPRASFSGAVNDAGAGVVDALLGILRLAGEKQRQADVFAVDIFVGAVGLGVDA